MKKIEIEVVFLQQYLKLAKQAHAELEDIFIHFNEGGKMNVEIASKFGVAQGAVNFVSDQLKEVLPEQLETVSVINVDLKVRTITFEFSTTNTPHEMKTLSLSDVLGRCDNLEWWDDNMFVMSECFDTERNGEHVQVEKSVCYNLNEIGDGDFDEMLNKAGWQIIESQMRNNAS